jgi:site-specific DNA-methyltransferase (adenine-specific)/adenine-specific DNA-methyltransferase
MSIQDPAQGMALPAWDMLDGDAFALARDIPDGSVGLTVTSPPYNIGKVYEKRTNLAAYLAPYEDFARTLFAKTAPGGSVAWQVGNFVEKGEVYPLDIFYYAIFKDAGFHLRNRIIWHFEHGLHASLRLSGRYETILWFTKGDDYTFNLDPIRVPSKYPGKRAFKGDKKGQPSGNPAGKNPSDFWPAVASDWDRLVWEIPNVKANHPEKTGHPCQFPIELAERLVLALTREGDLVLDPFAGVGSAGVAALRHGRRFLGMEWDADYAQATRDRIAQFARGELPIRPLGKPVYQPGANDRIARRPEEWGEQ